MTEKLSKPICGANKAHGGICQSTVLGPNGRCRMHGGYCTNKHSITTGRYSRTQNESLSAKIQEFLENGDPLDAMYPVATSIVALVTHVDQFKEGVPLSSKDISNLTAWSESIVRSITRIVDAKTKMALTAAEVQLIVARMADIANEFVPAEKHNAYFDALNSLFKAKG
jgi:hypothetical protein